MTSGVMSVSFESEVEFDFDCILLCDLFALPSMMTLQRFSGICAPLESNEVFGKVLDSWDFQNLSLKLQKCHFPILCVSELGSLAIALFPICSKPVTVDT